MSSLPSCPTKSIPLELAVRYAGAKLRSADLSTKHQTARAEAMRVQSADPNYKASDPFWKHANEIKSSMDAEIRAMNQAADEILALAESEGAGTSGIYDRR